jgi:hypothetical protein
MVVNPLIHGTIAITVGIVGCASGNYNNISHNICGGHIDLSLW